jgi:hypothetical protein
MKPPVLSFPLSRSLASMSQRSPVLFYSRLKYNFDVTEALLNYLLDSGFFVFHAKWPAYWPTAFKS